MKEYNKSHLTYEEQADQLIIRNLTADRDQLIKRLKSVSYYRLSGYLYPYRKIDASGAKIDLFQEESSLDKVWGHYCFDRRLRVLLIDAIERVEVAVRSTLIYFFSEKHGAFGHLKRENLPLMKLQDYSEWNLKLVGESNQSKEIFKVEFFKKYEPSNGLPIWMLAELMSMGSCHMFLKGVDPEVKKAIAKEFELDYYILESWFHTLNYVRNLCAHHSRMWNRELRIAIKLPKTKDIPAWSQPEKFKNNRTSTTLFVCRYFLKKISPTSDWHTRVEKLLDDYPMVYPQNMGLPVDWKNHPLWLLED